MKTREVNWKWPEVQARFGSTWEIGTKIPSHLLSEGILPLVTRERFEQGPDVFFGPLREAQPLTWQQIQQCGTPCLVEDAQYPEVVNIAMAAGDLAVFVEPFNENDDFANWDEIYKSLPSFLHGYYTNFNGMRASYTNPMTPHNLPANEGKWIRVSDYRAQNSISKKDVSRMNMQLGDLDDIFIIIRTEWNDLVLINGNVSDGRVYVVPDGKFADYFELADAAHQIDSMCAHVLTGTLEPFQFQI